MKITELPLFTDENINPEAVNYLRSAGFDVTDVLEVGWKGMDDEQILNFAHKSW